MSKKELVLIGTFVRHFGDIESPETVGLEVADPTNKKFNQEVLLTNQKFIKYVMEKLNCSVAPNLREIVVELKFRG